MFVEFYLQACYNQFKCKSKLAYPNLFVVKQKKDCKLTKLKDTMINSLNQFDEILFFASFPFK